jgi:hypothetical protein
MKSLVADYAGADLFNPSTSAPYDHEVVRAPTATMINYSNPNPSAIDQSVTISYDVISEYGNPTGMVIVTDGFNVCTGTVVAGSCTITFDRKGLKLLQAQYTGDSNFFASESEIHGHLVLAGPLVPIPTLSQWALLLLAMLMLMIGFGWVRRRA